MASPTALRWPCIAPLFGPAAIQPRCHTTTIWAAFFYSALASDLEHADVSRDVSTAGPALDRFYGDGLTFTSVNRGKPLIGSWISAGLPAKMLISTCRHLRSRTQPRHLSQALRLGCLTAPPPQAGIQTSTTNPSAPA